MAAGVRWFLTDWFGFDDYDQWPRGKKAVWFATVALISALPTFSFVHWLSYRCLAGLEGWFLFGGAATIFVLSIGVGVAVAVAVAGVGAGVGASVFVGSTTGAWTFINAAPSRIANAIAGAGAGAGAITGGVAVASAVVGVGGGAGEQWPWDFILIGGGGFVLLAIVGVLAVGKAGELAGAVACAFAGAGRDLGQNVDKKLVRNALPDCRQHNMRVAGLRVAMFVTAFALEALVLVRAFFGVEPVDAVVVFGTVLGMATAVVSVVVLSAIVGLLGGAIPLLVLVVIGGIIGGASVSAGLAIRGFVFRATATLCYLPTGAKRLPANWRENNFLTDSFLPAELMPGIRDSKPMFCLDGLAKVMGQERDRFFWVFYPLAGIFFFLPAFLYRLNIKATAWFWWPLSYLLKPAPVADAEGQQKQALCWPWTNPFQKLWIIVSVLLVLVSLTLHHLDLAAWFALKNVPALPLALKVSLAIDWSHLAPWHWAQWIIAGAGAGMLALAGNARSHDVNGNWRAYRQRWPQNIRLMTGLQRLRTLATIALLLMALGALLLQDQTWQTHLSVPESWVAALKRFYQN